jgi:uncharacterized membrane protein
MRKEYTVLLMSILMSLFIFNAIPYSANADPLTNITIEAEPTVEVDVKPGTRGFTNVTGTCTYEDGWGGYIFVRLYANCSLGNATVTPFVLLNGTGDKSDFDIALYGKLGSSSSEKPIAIINGTWDDGSNSGEIEPFTIQIIVLPYYNINVNSNCKPLSSGESKNADMWIENTGNANDTYTINISNRDELERKGISVDTIRQVFLKEDEEDKILVKVRTLYDTPPDSYSIDIAFTSMGSGKVVAIHPVVVHVEMGVFQVITHPMTIIITLVIMLVVIIVYLRKTGRFP